MKLPGRRLLQQWDLSAHKPSLSELIRSCQQVALTGFTEITFQEAAALIFYYQGLEVNALYREGPVAYTGRDALARLDRHGIVEEGAVAIYELPLDMAHLLRGITNRQRLKEPIRGRAGLAELVHGLEKSGHTGTLELSFKAGSGILLIVRGRVSNTYWESAGGSTSEGAAAHRLVDQALDAEEPAAWLSHFSRDVFMERHELQRAVESRLTRREAAPAVDQLAQLEQARRNEALEELAAHLPSLVRAFVFDLPTGLVLAQRGAAGALPDGGGALARLAEALPGWTRDLRSAVEGEDGGALDLVEVAAGPYAAYVRVVAAAQEAVVVITERSQAPALVGAALVRAAHAYAESLRVPASGS